MTIVLEQWLHDKIRQECQQNAIFSGYSGLQLQEKINRTEINKYHFYKLRESLKYAYNNSSFYRELYNQNGIEPDKIVSVDDWDKVPFTTPEALIENPGRLLCVSLGKIARTISILSSGTTGRPKKILYTPQDIDKIVDFMSAGMRAVASEGDVVHIILHGGSAYGQLDLLARGVAKMGATPIKAGVDHTPGEHLELIKTNRATLIFGQTGRIYRITQELLAEGHELSNLGVRILYLTSVYLPGAMRRRLESAWNCEVYLHYGMSEMGLAVATECSEHNGFHMNEADLYLEIIDPATGRIIEDETEGEMVFSTLTRAGVPLIRYRTRDISRWIKSPCSCGAATLLRFAGTNRRLESIMKLSSGDEIYPSLFDDVLYSIPQLFDYEVEVSEQRGKEQFLFTIETIGQDLMVAETINKILMNCPVINKNINSGRMFPPAINLIPYGSLDHSRRAKKLILDKRNI